MTTVEVTLNSGASDSAIPEALATGLLGMDAARRVGWAKAFEALRRVDGLEEEVRQTRDELKWLRRSYSRLVGFVTVMGSDQTAALSAELRNHQRAEAQFGHDDAWDAGAAVAWKHKAEKRHWTDEQLANIKKEERHKRDRHRLINKAEQNGHSTTNAAPGFSCSCGARSDTDHRWNHIAQVVTGLTFDEWDAKWQAEYTQPGRRP